MTTSEEKSLGQALDQLLSTIEARAAGGEAASSYTAQLLGRGTGKCAEKLGEEAVEAVIAAVSGDKENLAEEAADLLYHLGVLLKSAGVGPEEVAKILRAREGQSGLEEKAGRTK